MRRARAMSYVAALLASVGTVEVARAQLVSPPGADPVYMFDYATSGRFRCAWPAQIVIGSCTANGNTATLERGGVQFTLTFTGTSGTTFVTNKSQSLTLGLTTARVTGAPTFTPPEMLTFPGLPMLPILDFELMFTNSTFGGRPQAGILGWYGVFPNGLRSMGAPEEFAGWTMFSRALFHDITMPTITYTNNAVLHVGEFGLIPEPSTYVLFGTGLLGLAGIAARKRKAQSRES